MSGAKELVQVTPVVRRRTTFRSDLHFPAIVAPIVTGSFSGLSRELWEKIQQHLRDQAATHRERPTKAPPSPLAGKLFDENSEPLYVQGAVKGTRHYRYYVSRGLVRGSVQDDQRGWRVAAPELERAVRAATQRILGDRAAIAGAIEELDIDASRLPSIFKVAEAWIQSLRSEAEASSTLVRLIESVGLRQDGFRVSIKLPIPSDEGRDAAGVSSAQDRRGDSPRPPARRPQHSSDDPENRTAPALERATASSGTPIDSRGRSCLRQAFFPRTLPRKMSAGSQMDMPKSQTENFDRFLRSDAVVGILRVHGRA